MRALVALSALAIICAAPAWAEEWDAAAADTPKPAARRVVKKPPVRKKTEPVATLPAAPVPYTSLKSAVPATKSSTTLQPITKSETVTAMTIAAEPAVPGPPPAPPTVVVNLKTLPAAPKPASGEILLKCDTTMSAGKGNGSSGSFYLSLIPSEAFPDSGADVKVMSIDPNHASIIRDTLCFSFRCNAAVSPNYYELVDQTQKKGGYFKVSLNRKTGGFVGQKRWSDKRFGLGSSEAISETGTCRPQTTGGPVLF